MAYARFVLLGDRTQKEQTKDATTSSSQEISARDKVIANYLNQMALEEKVGQMIFARMPSAGQAEALETYDFGAISYLQVILKVRHWSKLKKRLLLINHFQKCHY